MTAPELSLVVPAHNEAARLPGTVDAIIAFFAERLAPAELVLVDDGSTDTTAEIITATAARLPAHVVLRAPRHRVNRGKGAAVRTGCLAATGDFVLYADADLAVPLEEADRLLNALRAGCDVAIGSRVQADGSDMRASQPLMRRMSGRGFTLLRRWLAVGDIVDTQCPMKGFRREAAQRLFRRQKLPGWAFDAEILFLARQANMRICEMPVRWRHVPGSKLRPGPTLALRSLSDLVRLRLVHLRD